MMLTLSSYDRNSIKLSLLFEQPSRLSTTEAIPISMIEIPMMVGKTRVSMRRKRRMSTFESLLTSLIQTGTSSWSSTLSKLLSMPSS